MNDLNMLLSCSGTTMSGGGRCTKKEIEYRGGDRRGECNKIGKVERSPNGIDERSDKIIPRTDRGTLIESPNPNPTDDRHSLYQH